MNDLTTYPSLRDPRKRKQSKSSWSTERIVLIVMISLWLGTGILGVVGVAVAIWAKTSRAEVAQTAVVLPEEVSAKSTDTTAAAPATAEAPPIALPVSNPLPSAEKDAPARAMLKAPPANEATTAGAKITAFVPEASLVASKEKAKANSVQPSAMLDASKVVAGPPLACQAAFRSCIDLCPSGSIMEDGSDIGGPNSAEECERACANGKIRCMKEDAPARCTSFHGACVHFCEEQSDSPDECEDACDEGAEQCNSVAKKS